MPTGYEFSQELKQLAFNVIKFVKNEKNGHVISLNNVNDRLQSMLGISLVLVKRLKQEMREEQERMGPFKYYVINLRGREGQSKITLSGFGTLKNKGY